jgi:hypothetical protein
MELKNIIKDKRVLRKILAQLEDDTLDLKKFKLEITDYGVDGYGNLVVNAPICKVELEFKDANI